MKTGEKVTFWCTLLLFNRDDGQCFIPPIILHQAKEYYQYLHHNVPLDWIVHHTPSDYMDRDGWLKYMTRLSNVCGASHVNNQIPFFDGHNSHFDDGSLRQMMFKNIEYFILKVGDSTNDQTNDNFPNEKLKSIYNLAKSKWMLNYRTTKFTTSPHEIRLGWSMGCLQDVRWKKNQGHIWKTMLPPPSDLPTSQQIPRCVLPSSKYILETTLKK